MTDATRFIATSIVRRAGQTGASGFARVVARGDGAVLTCFPVPESIHRAHDPNPRGGLRGARGVSAWGDRLVMANADRLFVLRPDWRIEREITHPWMGGVHGILAEEDGIWVTCTVADLLLKVGWDGGVVEDWEWRRDAGLVAALGFSRLPPIDRAADYRDPDVSRSRVRDTVHLNGVRRGPEGLLLSFGRILAPSVYRRQVVSRAVGRVAQSIRVPWRPVSKRDKAPRAVPSGRIAGSTYAVVSLDASRRSAVLLTETDVAVPNHDVCVDGDLLVYCDTNRGRLVGVDAVTGAVRHAVAIPGAPSFVRGLAPLGGLRFLVGSQRPATVYEVDLTAGAVSASYPLGGGPDESVHSVCVVPKSFGSPTPPHLRTP